MPTAPRLAPLTLLLLLSACDGYQPAEPTPAKLPDTLVVVDQDGRPISGVLVDPDSKEARAVTDDQGRCTVTEGMTLAESVTLWRYGYESVEVPVATLEKAEPLLMRKIEARGHISVSVIDEAGGPAIGVRVGYSHLYPGYLAYVHYDVAETDAGGRARIPVCGATGKLRILGSRGAPLDPEERVVDLSKWGPATDEVLVFTAR